MRDNDDIADHSQGPTELQMRTANLSSDLNQTRMNSTPSVATAAIPSSHQPDCTAAAQPATRTGGLGQEANPSGWGATTGSPGGGGGCGGWRTSLAGGGTAWGGRSGSGSSHLSRGIGRQSKVECMGCRRQRMCTNSSAQITGWSSPNSQTRRLERVMRVVNGAGTWSYSQ